MMSVVETTAGPVGGAPSAGVHVFRGIPYAAPPVGELRFRPPHPVAAWTGVRPCHAFGPAALQNPSRLDALMERDPVPTSEEDCLTLNVWTPGLDGGRRPVAVWIHGGGFVTGSSRVPSCDGSGFARSGGVVVVSCNYRLGAFGFLHGLGEGSGNAGLLDQVAALRWVADNIERFGGDPANVTVFGQSAGAMSIAALLAAPAARGLFAKVVLQSGAGYQAKPPDDADAVTAELLAELGLEPAPGAAAALRKVPAARILEAQAVVTGRHRAPEDIAFSPVADGAVLQGPVVATPAAALVGTTRDECNLFAALRPDSARCSAAATDRLFRYPARELADGLAGQGVPTFVYEFAWPTPVLGGRLGACHGVELPFVFDTLGDAACPEVSRLAGAVHGAWTAFFRTGAPSLPQVPWPAYDPSRRSTMVLDLTCRVERV